MSVITMEALNTEQPDPYEAFVEAAGKATALGVPEHELEAITLNFDLSTEEQTKRINELIEFRRGDRSADEFDSLPVDDAKIALVVYESDIDPSVAMRESGDIELTESEQSGSRLSNLRSNLARELGTIDVDPEIIDGAVLVASELGGNVIRRNAVRGGRLACGFDPIGRLVVTAEGKPNPEGVDFSLGMVDDAAERGRGLEICKGLGEVSRYPASHDSEGNPNAWGLTCTLETPQSQALAKLVFQGVKSPYDLGFEAAQTVAAIDNQTI